MFGFWIRGGGYRPHFESTWPDGDWESKTIRICECGAIHDCPDAGCPHCGSKCNTAVPVLPASLCRELARELESIAAIANDPSQSHSVARSRIKRKARAAYDHFKTTTEGERDEG